MRDIFKDGFVPDADQFRTVVTRAVGVRDLRRGV